MNFLFACGGTGGHINPAIAVAQRLRILLPDCRILFVGADDNMEMELVPREGFEIRGIRVGNLHRSLRPREISHNVRSAALLLDSVRKAGSIVREFQPDAVLGTGGYVCYPVLRAAALRKVPTLLHEANAHPGLTTRMLEPYTDRLMVAFEEGKQGYRRPERVQCVGMPVRGSFREQNRAANRRELVPDERPLVLSFGGSLGSERLNTAVAALIAENEKTRRIRLIHATGGGEAGAAAMRQRLEALGVSELRYAELRPYIYDMPKLMAAADLILCRAGASTLGELAAAACPAILVPYPYATGDHQTKNARVFENAGAARLLSDEACTPEALCAAVRELTGAPETLRAMSAAAAGLDRPDALDRIVENTLELAQKKQNR